MNLRAQLLPAAALLILSILLWRQFSLEEEIASLRAGMLAVAKVPTKTSSPAPVFSPTSNDSETARLQDTLTNLEARIADLEGVSSDMARIVNQALDEKEAREAARPKASWSAAQATGAPDTATAGDQATAWAPAAQDGGEEWIELAYDAPVEVAQVLVRETFNPGAISKVSVVLENGTEIPIWQGTQPAMPGPIDRIFPAPGGLVARGAKIYLDTKRVPGWNEIDAVALVGRGGTRNWAAGAKASSSYGGKSSLTGQFSSVLSLGEEFLLKSPR